MELQKVHLIPDKAETNPCMLMLKFKNTMIYSTTVAQHSNWQNVTTSTLVSDTLLVYPVSAFIAREWHQIGFPSWWNRVLIARPCFGFASEMKSGVAAFVDCILLIALVCVGSMSFSLESLSVYSSQGCFQDSLFKKIIPQMINFAKDSFSPTEGAHSFHQWSYWYMNKIGGKTPSIYKYLLNFAHILKSEINVQFHLGLVHWFQEGWSLVHHDGPCSSLALDQLHKTFLYNLASWFTWPYQAFLIQWCLSHACHPFPDPILIWVWISCLSSAYHAKTNDGINHTFRQKWVAMCSMWKTKCSQVA